MARKRKADDADKPTRKKKLTVYVDEETANRFGVHAQYLARDKSAYFAELVNTHCKRFVVQDRGGRSGEDETAA